jgi:hypothetical protein
MRTWQARFRTQLSTLLDFGTLARSGLRNLAHSESLRFRGPRICFMGRFFGIPGEWWPILRYAFSSLPGSGPCTSGKTQPKGR